ncbi:MAG: hypothetical protein OXU45_07340 [Candidatus Melainabacteria bacterium]|nr:hypothetical protein [Candidatus Melainabacteria bacterium]
MPTKVFLKENCSKVRGNKTIIGSANDRVKVHGKHSAFDNFKVAQIYFDRNGYVESLDLHNVIRELSVPVPYCLIAETGRPFQIGDIFETPSEVVINPESRAYDHDESRRESIRTWFQTNGLDPQKQTRFEVEKRVTKDLPIP